ncbi:MAG: hypothetical protein ACRDT8_11315 [Micromonosporaceae bacterium]
MPDRLSFRHPPRFLAATVSAFLVTGAVGWVASRPQEDSLDKKVHCIDEDGNVVDPDYCDENRSSGFTSYWLYVTARRYALGNRVPDDHKTRRIDPSDKKARAKAGIPATGRVAGKTIRGSGFGYHGGGSGYHGGGGYWGGGS